MTCNTCKHWKPFRAAEQHRDELGEGDLGTCQRYPPVLDHHHVSVTRTFPTDTSLAWIQPVTQGHETCGEHAAILPWPLSRLFAWGGT